MFNLDYVMSAAFYMQSTFCYLPNKGPTTQSVSYQKRKHSLSTHTFANLLLP